MALTCIAGTSMTNEKEPQSLRLLAAAFVGRGVSAAP
jgi:hypothetical protein